MVSLKPVDPHEGWRTQIVVVASHNDLRRGQRAEVLITPRLRRLAAQGLIRLVGEPVDPNRDTASPADVEPIEDPVEESADGGED